MAACHGCNVGTAVALRKESVDRNGIDVRYLGRCSPSLSARRAWIEIPALILDTGFEPVALRKESVDRNSHLHDVALEIIGSLSARRAWIEIAGAIIAQGQQRSLSARRAWIEMSVLN